MTGRKFSFGSLFGRRPNPMKMGGQPTLITGPRPSMSLMQRLKELLKRPINAIKRHRNGRA